MRKKWRLADAGFGHSLARLIEDSLPCGVEFRGVVGPRASRAHVGGREKDNGILNPALAERGPIEILECGHEIRHELPHFRFRSGLSAKRRDDQGESRNLDRRFGGGHCFTKCCTSLLFSLQTYSSHIHVLRRQRMNLSGLERRHEPARMIVDPFHLEMSQTNYENATGNTPEPTS